MNTDLIKKEFKDIINFPRAVSNKLKVFDTSELNEYLKEHFEFENIRNLIRCICLNIELPICETCGKSIPYSKRKNRFCCMKCTQQNSNVREKSKNTFDKNYRQNPEKMKVLRKKIKDTQIEKYGGYGFQSKELKEKAYKTVKEKYGVDNVFQNEEIKKKIKEKNLEKYGVEYPIQNKEIYNKVINTSIERYGTKHPMQSEIGKQFFKNAMQEKYGVNWARQSEEIQKRSIENSYKKYGFNHPNVVNAWNTIQQFSDKVIPMFEKKDFKGLGYIYKWKCVKCENEFEALLGTTTFIDKEFERLPRCENCYPRNGRSSIKERDLAEFCKQYFPNLLINDRQTIKPFELDIVIPDIRLALEFNGNYWHSTEGWLDKNRDLTSYFNRHLNKTITCNKIGYRLIHIWEDEWDNKNEELKQKLIEIFKGTESLQFADKELLLDRSWYNNVDIPGYSLIEEVSPCIVKRDSFEVENCGYFRFGLHLI